MSEQKFKNFYGNMNVIEIMPSDNTFADPRQLEEIEVSCGTDLGLYSRHVLGKWVWGGGDSALNPFNTGGRYDPFANAWTPTTTTNAPVAREAHAAAFNGGDAMMIWGGADATLFGVNSGAIYNVPGNSWVAIGWDSGTPRWGQRSWRARTTPASRMSMIFSPQTVTWVGRLPILRLHATGYQ